MNKYTTSKKRWIAIIWRFLFSGNNDHKERYTRDCKEIDLLKKGITHYEQGDWDKWSEQYVDSAKIYQNTWEVWSSPAVTLERHKSITAQLSSYGFQKEDLSMERVIDDRGRVWVNTWGLWRGTLKANNKVIEIPVHLTIQFKDGKIIEEIGFWNSAILYGELNALQKAANDNTN